MQPECLQTSSGSLRFEDVVARDVGLDTEGVEDAVVSVEQLERRGESADLASVHDQDAIGAEGAKNAASVRLQAPIDGLMNIPKNRLDSMSNRQEGLVAEFGPDGGLDPRIRFEVDTGRCFVQADDLAVAHECPCKRDQTALADGKIGSFVLDGGIERKTRRFCDIVGAARTIDEPRTPERVPQSSIVVKPKRIEICSAETCQSRGYSPKYGDGR